MNHETVIVVPTQLDDALRQIVVEACDHARVRPVFWGEGEQDAASPSLLIAALSSGQRTIPDDVTSLATDAFRGVPMLLLSPEPLVRNSVSLQGGRVTLLGHPLSREKVSARIRTALVARAVGDVGAASDAAVLVREYRGREWWAGSLTRDPHRGQRPPDAGDLFPTVCKLGRQGLAGLVPLDVLNPLSVSALHQAAAALVSSPPNELTASIESALGTEAAAVWFSPASPQWSFYAPRREAELWLYSPLRLPNVSRLGPAGRGHWRHLTAAPGDIVLLGTGMFGEGEGGALGQRAEGGGPAILDDLEARFAGRDGPGTALIVELR